MPRLRPGPPLARDRFGPGFSRVPLADRVMFLDLEIFDLDYVEPPSNIGGGLLRPVLSPVRLSQSAQTGPWRASPDYARSEAALGAGRAWRSRRRSPLLLPHIQAGCTQQLAGRQGCGHDHPAVDADDLPGAGRQNGSRNGREGDMPTARPVHHHPVGLHLPRHRRGTTGTRTHPAFGTQTWPTLRDRRAHIPLLTALPHDPEPLVPAGLAPTTAAPARFPRSKKARHRVW